MYPLHVCSDTKLNVPVDFFPTYFDVSNYLFEVLTGKLLSDRHLYQSFLWSVQGELIEDGGPLWLCPVALPPALLSSLDEMELC